MATYINKTMIDGVEELPRLTQEEFLAIPVAERPKIWVKRNATETDRGITAEDVEYDSSNNVKQKIDTVNSKVNNILNAFFSTANIKNIDLDRIFESGCYLITDNSVSHRPASGWLILLVFRPYYDSNGNIAVQLATTVNNTGFYIRTTGGGAWTAWKQITIS